MENKRPFFSIIIPTYNHGHLIKRCLDSIVAQTYPYWEAIIVNNFSKDNTVEIVENYQDERIRLVNNANHGIIAASRNKGLELAQGDWICFLDSDDWWRDDKLETCLPFLEHYDFLYHDLAVCQNGKMTGKVMRGRDLDKKDFIADILLSGNPIANSSTVIRRTIVDTVGFLTETHHLVAVEDVDYWLRIMTCTDRVKYIPLALGYYWMGTNISQKLAHISKEKALLAKYIGCLSEEQAKIARKVLSYKIARLYHSNKCYHKAVGFYFNSITTATDLKYLINPIMGIALSLFHIRK